MVATLVTKREKFTIESKPVANWWPQRLQHHALHEQGFHAQKVLKKFSLAKYASSIFGKISDHQN